MILKLLKLAFNRERPTAADIFFAYRIFFRRAPDRAGWQAYLDHLDRHNMSLDWILDAFMSSQECYERVVDKKGIFRDYGSDPVSEETVELADFKIVVDARDDFVGKEIRTHGRFEPEVRSALDHFLKPGATMIDVGANIGYFSLVGARAVGPDGLVVAVEPLAQNCDLLEKSAALNGLTNIELHRAALLDRSAEVGLVQFDRFNSGSAHLMLHQSSHDSIPDVAGLTLDELAAGRKIDLIKMDVEGAEGLVLKGAARTLEADRPVLIMEFNPLNLYEVSRMTGDEVLDLLDGKGYRFYELDGFGPEASALTLGQVKELTGRRADRHLELIATPH